MMACLLALGGALAHAQVAPPATHPSGRYRDASTDDYRKHLTELSALTQACAKARDVEACDPTLVGPDDRVPVGGGTSGERRLVRYGWLRVLFSRSEETDEAQDAPRGGKAPPTAADSARPKAPSTSQLLDEAEARLAGDLALTEAAHATVGQHVTESNMMRQVLAGREFRNLKQRDERDSLLERTNRWINHFFEGLERIRARSAWVGRALFWGFMMAVGVGLTWALLRLERRWRVRLVPEGDGPAPGAASARDWQLWLADAREAAAGGRWREAIHFLYWAAISRLESKRVWPADRARTPREYLALMAPEDSRTASLSSLTGTFERTWYGGRSAGEGDYRRAEELAAGLMGVGAVDVSGRMSGPAAESGAH